MQPEALNFVELVREFGPAIAAFIVSGGTVVAGFWFLLKKYADSFQAQAGVMQNVVTSLQNLHAQGEETLTAMRGLATRVETEAARVDERHLANMERARTSEAIQQQMWTSIMAAGQVGAVNQTAQRIQSQKRTRKAKRA